MFVHHVFFWLQPGADRQALIAGLQALTSVKSIKAWHIGVPAATSRPVIDSTYAVSWMLQFDSAADEAIYQDHPDHHRFIAECSHLWERVVVYDSVEV
jgi:Stress responsive A/B Barrel Domain